MPSDTQIMRIAVVVARGRKVRGRLAARTTEGTRQLLPVTIMLHAVEHTLRRIAEIQVGMRLDSYATESTATHQALIHQRSTTLLCWSCRFFCLFRALPLLDGHPWKDIRLLNGLRSRSRGACAD